jgi:hypothetical protein
MMRSQKQKLSNYRPLLRHNTGNRWGEGEKKGKKGGGREREGRKRGRERKTG